MKLPRVRTPEWLLGRFEALYKDPPHYEASYYGPINGLLTVHFPVADGFLVTPQARLRQPPKGEGRTSIDSVGQVVGTFDDDGSPDFVVSYGSAELHQDVPLLIYEVKNEDTSFESTAAQMDRYIAWGKEYQGQAQGAEREIWGVLVIGSKSNIFYLDPKSLKQVKYSEFGLNTMGTHIMELLQTVRESTELL